MFKVVISLTILERKFDFEKNMRKMTKKSISLAKISHFAKIIIAKNRSIINDHALYEFILGGWESCLHGGSLLIVELCFFSLYLF